MQGPSQVRRLYPSRTPEHDTDTQLRVEQGSKLSRELGISPLIFRGIIKDRPAIESREPEISPPIYRKIIKGRPVTENWVSIEVDRNNPMDSRQTEDAIEKASQDADLA